MRVCQEWADHLLEDANWFRDVTVDEICYYSYHPEMKQQSTQWVKKGAGLPEKARAMKSGLKVILIALFDS